MRFPTEEQGNHFRAGPALDPGPSCSHQVKAKSGNNVLKVWLLWEERDPFNSIIHPVSGQTLVLGLSKITMRSLNAGKSSRLVVTVEPCLGTQHLHVLAKFPASFPHEMTLEMWGCLFKFTGNQPVYQFVGNGFKCYMKPDNLNLFQDFLKRTLADIPFCNRLQLGMSFMIASQVWRILSNFRVTITCQPPESAWCFKDRVT